MIYHHQHDLKTVIFYDCLLLFGVTRLLGPIPAIIQYGQDASPSQGQKETITQTP